MITRRHTIAALACVLAAPLALAEPAAPKVTIEHRFPISADAAWKELGRFCSIAEWQSLVGSCVVDERKEGIYRTIVMKDSSVFVEKLEEYSTGERSLAYTIKAGPLPITDYRSELRFVPAGANETKLVWRAWYAVPQGGDAARIATDLQGLFANGIKGMESVLASSLKPAFSR